MQLIQHGQSQSVPVLNSTMMTLIVFNTGNINSTVLLSWFRCNRRGQWQLAITISASAQFHCILNGLSDDDAARN
ncbi:hypothetical protein CKO09_12735 [Chromatium weissei]|nr:hypothetical protein [Chromatium weissei]